MTDTVYQIKRDHSSSRAGTGLDHPVQYLKGVGPARAARLACLGIGTVRDLLGLFPREYEDRRSPARLAGIAHGDRVVAAGIVRAVEEKRLGPSLAVLRVAVDDGSAAAWCLFFRKSNPYQSRDVFATLRREIVPGVRLWATGLAERQFGRLEIRTDDYEAAAAGQTPRDFERIVPVYPLTQGISQRWLRGLTRSALAACGAQWADLGVVADETAGMPSSAALQAIHYPRDPEEAERARRRLAFDEFFLIQVALAVSRRGRGALEKTRRYEVRRTMLGPFRKGLSFDFTPAQKRVIREIFSDMQARRPMSRLLMGDVGSGKTVVALSAILLAVENGYQAVFCVPTEILAEQHVLTIRRMLGSLPIRCDLMSGRPQKKKQRAEMRQALADGSLHILIATHAVFESDVTFKNLGIAVIDEQHRFGVEQRAGLVAKGQHPDLLLMTATPIPRSLALTIYGDMDVSVIDALPPGRQPISTRRAGEAESYRLLLAEVRRGRQGFVVFPLVEESDLSELKAVVQEAESLATGPLKSCRVAVLHGRMKAQEKESVMNDFRAHRYDVLVATTVIEVGIDIPNASMMIIQHADRFGLATLHQLRGRVGRGTERSQCILVGGSGSPLADRRLNAMVRTSDGFRIADEDLALRGPGEFFGTQQHGLPRLRAGDLARDGALIANARDAAAAMLAGDPTLALEAHKPVRAAFKEWFGDRLHLVRGG